MFSYTVNVMLLEIHFVAHVILNLYNVNAHNVIE